MPKNVAAVGRRRMLGDAFWVWCRVAALSFGGPAGQIAVMHRIIVDEKKWIDEPRFLHALNFCMLLPGPEAQQLATYIGWLRGGVLGGLMAGLLFILPGFVAIMALSLLYVAYSDAAAIEGLFFGLRAAVLALVLQAVVRIGRRALKTSPAIGVAAAAFVAIFLFGAPFPAVVLAAAAAGWIASSAGKSWFFPHLHQDAIADGAVRAAPPRWVALALIVAWLFPVALIVVLTGPDSVYAQISLFFSKMAVVTFGGAYAVLAYLAQDGVAVYGWLTAEEMIDGLAMAESTPGPLIMVVQFAAFMGAWRETGSLWMAALGGALAIWVTFTPCFLWIFLGAPYAERLRRAPGVAQALGAITAGVVGVILNLAVWFGLHTLFGATSTARLGPLFLPSADLSTFDPAAAALGLAAIIAVFRFKAGTAALLSVCAAIGIALYLSGYGQ